MAWAREVSQGQEFERGLDPDLENEGSVASEGTPEGDSGDEGSGEGTRVGSEERGEFFSLEDIPEEHREMLRPSWRAMQRAWTQKHQALADRSREMNRVEYQAGLLQELLQNPRVAKFLREEAARERQGDASGEPLPSSDGHEAGSDEADFDPSVQRMIQREVERHLRRHVAPVQEQLSNLEGRMTVSQEREAFVRRHPDYEDYLDDMEDVFRAHGADIPMELAYQSAWFKRDQQRKSALARQQQARASGLERGGTPRPVRTTNPKPARNWGEALEAAFEELGLDPQQYGYRRR